MKRESQFYHACKMVIRNFRSYAMLSITIVFSFAILLGYLAFTDSNLYNEYKEIFSSPREIVMAYTYDKAGEIDVLIGQVDDQVPGTTSYRYIEVSSLLSQYDSVRANVTILPNHATIVYRDISDEKILENYSRNVRVVQGDGFPLNGNKSIINESFFRSVSPNGDLPIKLNIPIRLSNGNQIVWETEVVGVCEDIGEEPLYYDKDGHLTGDIQIYVSQSLLGGTTLDSLSAVKSVVLFNSPDPETVAAHTQNFDLVLHAVCLAQNKAIEKMRIQTETKFTIAVVLYVLLSINLFGCFSNALSERQFEIGVKRAIGASPMSIIGQFLMESLIVILCNTLLAVVITVDALAMYKLYQHLVQGTTWIVSVSIHSLLMFAVCSLGLTLVFSLFFADRATRVEIVKYLKAE